MASPLVNSLFTAWVGSSRQRNADIAALHEEQNRRQEQLLNQILAVGNQVQAMRLDRRQHEMDRAARLGALYGRGNAPLEEMDDPELQQIAELSYAEESQKRAFAEEAASKERIQDLEDMYLQHQMQMKGWEHPRWQKSARGGPGPKMLSLSQLERVPAFAAVDKNLGRLKMSGIQALMDQKGQLAIEQLSDLVADAKQAAMQETLKRTSGNVSAEVYTPTIMDVGNRVYLRYKAQIDALMDVIAHSEKAIRMGIGQQRQSGGGRSPSPGGSVYDQMMQETIEGLR